MSGDSLLVKLPGDPSDEADDGDAIVVPLKDAKPVRCLDVRYEELFNQLTARYTTLNRCQSEETKVAEAAVDNMQNSINKEVNKENEHENLRSSRLAMGKIETDVIVPTIKSTEEKRSEDRDGAGDSSKNSDPDLLSVGVAVEGRYGWGSTWYDATVMAVHASSSSKGETLYSLRYADGDVEEGVRRLKIRCKGERQSRVLKTGEEVEAACGAIGDKVVGGVVRRAGERTDEYVVSFDLSEAGEEACEGHAAAKGVVEEVVPRDRIFGRSRQAAKASSAVASVSKPETAGTTATVTSDGVVSTSTARGADTGSLRVTQFVSGHDDKGVMWRGVLSIRDRGSTGVGLAVGDVQRGLGRDGHTVYTQRYRSQDVFIGGALADFDDDECLGGLFSCTLPHD